ncbi:MAG: LysE family transporter [Desulfobulbaceae bacterium]|uniref:LysE family transporter n=1 Tax=Candidatus Desulfobia pelagia TaxID=2841692 RepID=A0A8J6NBR8_9BACT|nr:LysE family transporter [Candidatus Desulfobia pelagia]
MTFLTIGIILGLSAGLTPGPLLTLVISETLQHDVKSGIKVALAPVITDLPIVAVSIFILTRAANSSTTLGIISLAGGFFILYMGWEHLQTKGIKLSLQDVKPQSMRKGILANILSPYPYLFWISVGAPTMAKAIAYSSVAPLAFLGSFYSLLVGSKIVLALLTGKSKSFLSGKVYIYIMRFLGVVLCGFALTLFRESFELFF